MTSRSRDPSAATASEAASRPRKALTIGAVAKILEPGVRGHLDLQDPLPRGPEAARAPAHAGGYRLYSQTDVERLRAILRMQRDEFLPLRVIRQELATGDFTKPRGRRVAAGVTRRAMSVDAAVGRDQPGGADRPGRDQRVLPARARRSSGSSSPRRSGGRDLYDETDLEIVRAAAELSRFGVAGRNLRVFRSSADREAALLEQIVGAVAALAQPGAQARGRREPREPGRHLRAPQAPAAGARPPPPDRRVARPSRGDAPRKPHPA